MNREKCVVVSQRETNAMTATQRLHRMLRLLKPYLPKPSRIREPKQGPWRPSTPGVMEWPPRRKEQVQK